MVGYQSVEQDEIPVAAAVVVMDGEDEPVVANTSKTSTHNNNSNSYGGSELGRNPTVLERCPHCNSQDVRTRVTIKPSCPTWVASIVLLILFWPIFWIPLVVDSMKETIHYCCNCGEMVGKMKPFEDCCVKRRE